MSDDAEALFLQAVTLSTEERAAFLQQRCADDTALRERVEGLLAANDAAEGNGFLDSHFLNAISPSLASEEDAPESRAEAVARRFEILRKHQSGGLGEVWIAWDRQLNREVAIKQIQSRWRDHDEARQRFLQEAEVTARLEHPGVVPVYAMGKWADGRPYYAMRFIQGETLRDFIDAYHQAAAADPLDTNSRRMLRQLLNRFVDVCTTIDYAHSRGVLHRDLKPSNIMVGPYGEVLVVDWGLAKQLGTAVKEPADVHVASDALRFGSGSTPTRVGGAVGTPGYMSPEQASGDPKLVGTHTDIYLLGATLYHLLTGRPPYRGEDLAQLMENIKVGRFPAPVTAASRVARSLEAICLKAMATIPEQRYPSAAALAADVERWLADEPITVYRDEWSVRFSRWIRRHRTIATATAVAVVLSTIGAVFGVLFWSYYQAEKSSAERQQIAQQFQLDTQRQQRLAEITATVVAAERFADEEIALDRFSAGLSFLRNGIDAIGGTPSLQAERLRLEDRANRLQRIVDFYRDSEYAQEQSFLSRETPSIFACYAALQSLQVWEHADWWARLPSADLSAAQTDRLQWDVYRVLMLFDSLLVKTIGTQMGLKGEGGVTYQMLRSLFRSSEGKREARNALLVSDRVNRFRLSEVTRWYQSMSQARLRSGVPLRAEEMGPARNAPDRSNLGVLCIIASQDPGFQTLFSGYQGDDPLLVARSLFAQAVAEQPDHYWTLMHLGHADFLLAERQPEATWRDYNSAVQAAAHCIALKPERCFAYADRAVILMHQADLVMQDATLHPATRDAIRNRCVRQSLLDIEEAWQWGDGHPWIGWQHGRILYRIGRVEEALQRFYEASLNTYPLVSIQDAALVRVDDLRGRSVARQIALDRLQEDPQADRFHLLLATVSLNQQDFEQAKVSATQAVAAEDPRIRSHAFAVRGMAAMHAVRNRVEEDLAVLKSTYENAARDFGNALALDREHLWGRFGQAECNEKMEDFAAAREGYRAALDRCREPEQQAACWLGEARCAAREGENTAAVAALRRALELQPACDLDSVIRPLRERHDLLRQAGRSPEEQQRLAELATALLPIYRATQLRLSDEADSTVGCRVAVLNGGFELGRSQYWTDELGGKWKNSGGYAGRAEVVRGMAKEGEFALRIEGDISPSDQRRGETAQTFPVAWGAGYRVRVWVRAEGLAEHALRIENGSGEVILECPPGDYDWQERTAVFYASRERGAGDWVDGTLRIVSAGPGEAWLDEIRVEALE